MGRPLRYGNSRFFLPRESDGEARGDWFCGGESPFSRAPSLDLSLLPDSFSFRREKGGREGERSDPPDCQSASPLIQWALL